MHRMVGVQREMTPLSTPKPTARLKHFRSTNAQSLDRDTLATPSFHGAIAFDGSYLSSELVTWPMIFQSAKFDVCCPCPKEAQQRAKSRRQTNPSACAAPLFHTPCIAPTDGQDTILYKGEKLSFLLPTFPGDCQSIQRTRKHPSYGSTCPRWREKVRCIHTYCSRQSGLVPLHLLNMAAVSSLRQSISSVES